MGKKKKSKTHPLDIDLLCDSISNFTLNASFPSQTLKEKKVTAWFSLSQSLSGNTPIIHIKAFTY